MKIFAIFSTTPLPLVLLPLLAAVGMLLIRQSSWRYRLLVSMAVLHFCCAFSLLLRFVFPEDFGPIPTALNAMLYPDALGTLFLNIASLLFVAAALYAVDYLHKETCHNTERTDFQDGTTFTNAPEQRFLACLCIFLAAISLVTTTRHMGVLWVGIECTTLSSAPLIYYHRHRRSLEATWKYLMICSVGIALALLGNILYSVAFYPAHAGMNQLAFFMEKAAQSQQTGGMLAPWLKAAFVLLLVGYGTKMGLAPLHNWLPDAHSQAPSLVSALLSGALLNCAFLGILRGHQIMQAAGLGSFSGDLLIFFGLLSMGMAAIFIVNQGHYKRLLAYSSVEHMGILALGVGLGGNALFGTMLHAICHSLTKCMLFLLAGNILYLYHTHSSYDARGLRWTMPITAALWMAGFLALTGSPPFGIFVSKLIILQTLIQEAHWWKLGIYLGAFAIIFVGMSVPMLRMVQGNKPPALHSVFQEKPCNIAPPLILCCLVLLLGVWIPDWLERFLRLAAAHIGGGYGI